MQEAQHAENYLVRVHALATERIMNDPEESFEAAMYDAHQQLSL